jgi:hypothetical protein
MSYATTKVYKEANPLSNNSPKLIQLNVTIKDDVIERVTINGVTQVIYEDDYETFVFVHETLDHRFVTLRLLHPLEAI